MPLDVEFLIVGAGFAGAATAWALRQRVGARGPRILVVEKESLPGAHSSGRNAALVRRHVEDPTVAAMARQGGDLLAEGRFADFRKTGSVLIGAGSDRVPDFFPLADGRGLWCPDDGVIDIAGLMTAYLDGIDVRFDTEVEGWCDATGPDGPLRVTTSSGELAARTIVNAAGPWAGQLGGLALNPCNRHLFATPPMENIDPDWPFVWDLDHGLYFRPESNGLLLCACDETPAAPGQYDEDSQVAEQLAGLVRKHQPRLGELRIMRSWVGQRTFAPDRRFVIGHDPRDRRLFHVAGLGGHGVTTSPAVGHLAATLLLDPAAQSGPFNPARLANAELAKPR